MFWHITLQTQQKSKWKGGLQGYYGYCNLWGHKCADFRKRKRGLGANSMDWEWESFPT